MSNLKASSISSSIKQLGGEDFIIGEVVAERQVLLDATKFENFALLTGDKHPIHYSEEYAQSKGLRAPITHGLLLTALTALGAMPVSDQLTDSMIAMLGVEARFSAPVYIGDLITVRMIATGIERKSGNRCVVTFNVELLSENQDSCAKIIQHYLLKTSLKKESL